MVSTIQKAKARMHKRFSGEAPISDILDYLEKAIEEAGKNDDALDAIPWAQYIHHVQQRGTLTELLTCSSLCVKGDSSPGRARNSRRTHLLWSVTTSGRMDRLAAIIQDATSDEIAVLVATAMRNGLDNDEFYEVVQSVPEYNAYEVVSRLTWLDRDEAARALRERFSEIFEKPEGEELVALFHIIELAIGRHNICVLSEITTMLDGNLFADVRCPERSSTLLHCAVQSGYSDVILLVVAWLPPSIKKEAAYDPPLTPLECYTQKGTRHASDDPEVVMALSSYTKSAHSS